MMPAVTNTIDIAKLQTLVTDGYLTCRPHPTADLIIWNYTPRCQFEHYWTPETLMCRGLITTGAGHIVARPFPKFFNLAEHQGDLPLEPFTVTAKMDGSLGILYWMPDGEPRIATRGSFTSEQAIRATQILQERYKNLIPYLQSHSPNLLTYLFEIIYPANRIVVDYGEMEDIVLLAIIHTETGDEFNVRHISPLWPTPIVKHYGGIADLAQLQAIQEDNAEGFVIRFDSGLRLKCKFAEYVRLHRLITQVNARVIWDLLRNDQPFDELLERVPDEFYAWVKATRTSLLEQYNEITTQCIITYEEVETLPTRKEQAAIVTRSPYPGVVFAMLDKKPYVDIIWKMLRPSAEKPFREDADA
jgi:RNA ligase